MSLRPLIDKQKIRIDDHKRGNREIKNWKDKALDVHIDKETYYPIDGKIQKVKIRVPINSDRAVSVEIGKGSRQTEVPRRLKKEIIDALSNNEIREPFIKDVVDVLKDFDSTLSDETKASETLEKLSKHFDMKWTGKTIKTMVDNTLNVYTQTYSDENKKLYYVTIDERKIEIGEVRAGSRQVLSLKNH